MEELCKSKFLDVNSTLYTESLDFPICFAETVGVWVPCAFLWVFLPLQIYNLKYSEYRDIPWNYLNATKMILIAITTLLNASKIFNSVWTIYLYSAIINFITSVLYLISTYNCKKMGIQSSGILLTFSFLNVLCGLPNFIYYINHWNLLFDNTNEIATRNLSSIFNYLCNTIIFLLSCLADERPRRNLCSTEDEDHQNITNRQNESVLADVFLTWMDSYLWKYSHKPTNKILWHYYSKDDGYEDLLRKKGDYTEIRSTNSTKISILSLLNTKYGLIFWFTTFLNVLNEASGIGLFLCAHLLLSAIEFKEPNWKCYMIMIALCIVLISKLIIGSYFWSWCFKLEIEAKNAILITLYEKALRISSGARTKYNTSDIVNIMSVDATQLQNTPRTIHSLSGILIFISFAYIYLGFILGTSTCVSIIIFVLVLIVSYQGSDYLRKLQNQAAKHRDQRNRFLQEIISGIKVLKMYSWEPSFKNSAGKLREKEKKNLKQLQHTYVSIQVFLGFSPYLLFALTYLSYFLMKPNRSVGISPMIISMILFYQFRNYLHNLPTIWLSVLQGFIAVKRIDQFLSAEELYHNIICHDLTEKATFSWLTEKGPATLHNLNVQIEKGELVAIVGSVGAGKSSFISACLGEMYKMSGYANTKGSAAYVPQQAWILNTSFKTNIILDNEIEVKLYKKSLEACALLRDIDTFAGGDLTEIGEKGINLSGGQKQRISLARAICQNADIYYLDDPLSALDSQVANHVYHNAIGSKSILKEKTRILVTHSAKFLSFVDKIILLKNGHIAEIGIYQELLSRNKEFAAFVRTDSVRLTNEETNEYKRFIDRKRSFTESEDQEILRNESHDPQSKLIDEEIIITDQIQVYKRLLYSYISTAGANLTIGTVLLFILNQIIIILNNIYLGWWLNRDNPWETKYSFLLIYTGLGVTQGFAYTFSNICLFNGVTKTATILYKNLLDSVLQWPMLLFDTIPVGRIISRFSDDVFVLDNVIGYVINHAMSFLLKSIALYVQFICFVPETCIILIPSIFIFFSIQILFRPMFHQMKRLEAVHRSLLYSHLVESVIGFQSIRVYNFQNKFITRTINKNNNYSSAYYSSALCQQWLTNRYEIVGTIIYIFMFFIATSKKNDSDLQISYLAATISLGISILKMTTGAALQQSLLEEHMLSIERIQQYIRQPQETWDDSTINIDEKWPLNGVIEFQDYKLQYRPGTKYVLKGVSFRIQSGEKVGIVGRTGAGKSTIVLGLFRIVEPSGGTISIDGVDITKLGLHVLRSKLTVIPQDPVLFSGTLRFNIDPFEKHNDSSLWKVLEKSHLKQYVSGLTEGLNYKIEEGGKNLSFGQRQLICLARALLRKTKILVLDEATASVDLNTDELIQKTIRDEFSDCTVITIAHRLNTLQHYDKILVLDEGEIIKFDTVGNLMKSEIMNMALI